MRIETTPENMLYLFCLPIVVLESVIAMTALVCIIILCIRKGFSKRFLLYIYEIPLLILFFHFFLADHVKITSSPLSKLYWASLISFTLPIIYPLSAEWARLSSLGLRKVISGEKRNFGVGIFIVTLLQTAVFYYIMSFLAGLIKQ